MTKVPSELEVIAKEASLPQPKVNALLNEFAPVVEKARALAEQANTIVVTSEDERLKMNEARTLRLELKAMRVATDKTRKVLKEESLREGKAIDGLANVIKLIIEPAEAHLQLQEDFAKVAEEARKAKIVAERTSLLTQFDADPNLYNITDMDDESFDKLLNVVKEIYENKLREEQAAEKARIEAEQAEALRVAEMEKENARLKAEADEQAEALAAERAKAEEAAAAAKAAQDKIEAELRAERQRAEDARLAEMKANQEKADEELRIKRAEEEAAKKAQAAPDKEKLVDWVEQLKLAAIAPNTLVGEQSLALAKETEDYLNRVIKNLEQKAKQL